MEEKSTIAQDKKELDFAQLSSTDTLSQEEHDEIYKEMEQILKSTTISNPTNDLRGLPLGMKLPLISNFTIFLVVIGLLFGVWVLINNNLNKELFKTVDLSLESGANLNKQILSQNQEAAASQLSEAQERLLSLEQERAEKNKALKEFDIFHRNIAVLISKQNYTEAKSAITLAENKIKNGPYSDNEQAILYLAIYTIYASMIDQIQSLEESVDKAEAATSTQTKTTLPSNSGDAADQIKALEASYQDKISALESKNKNDIRKSIDDSLGTANLIAVYLNLKQSGIDDNNIKKQIESRIKGDKIYENFISTLEGIMGVDGDLNI